MSSHDDPSALTGPEPRQSLRAPSPAAPGRSRLDRLVIRLIATTGVVGIGVALGAILADNKVQGWITGLVVAVVSVILTMLILRQR